MNTHESHRTRTSRHVRHLTLLATALLASPGAATATVVTWTGATGLDWHVNENWSGGVAAGSVAGHTAVFTASPLGTVNLAASPLSPLRGITIGSGSGGTAGNLVNVTNIPTVNIVGSAITLAGGLETESGNATNARTVFFARTGGGPGAFVIDNDLVLDVTGSSSARFLLAGLVKTLTLNGVITNGSVTASGNNKGIAKDGDGTLTLTNLGNTFVGATEVTAGTLVLGGNAGTASGVLGIGSGAITLGNSNTGGTQNVSLVTNGEHIVGRDIVVSSANLSTGGVSIGNTGAATGTSTWTGNLTLNRTVELVSSNSAVADFTGVISGTGGVTKANSGIVRLSNAANSFAGPVTILNGTLSVASLNALGANSGAIVLGNSTSAVTGTLSYTGPSATLDRDLVVQTASTGGGNIDVPNVGQTLTIGSASRTISGTGRFVFGGFGDVDVASVVANTGNPVIKSGTGVGRLLNVNNNYTGQTFVRNGTLLVDAAGQLGTSSGITLIDATAIPEASPAFLTTAGITITQNISIDDVPNSTGTSTIGAAASQTTGTTTYAGSVTLNRPVLFTSDTLAGSSVTFCGAIVDGAGSYGVTKVGSGTVVLASPSNTYAGPTAVRAGTLLVNGNNAGTGAYSVDAGARLGGSGTIGGATTIKGTIAPGDAGVIGTLTIGAGLVLDAGAQTELQIGSANDVDRLLITGEASLNGSLTLATLDGFTPIAGQTQRVLDAATVVGQFATVTGQQISPTTWLAVTYDATGVNVTATRPGDADLNALVGFDDLLALAKNYNASGKAWADGDFDGTGIVDFNDLLVLAANYNQAAASQDAVPQSLAADWALAQSIVPEPAAIAAAAAGVATAMRRRRR